MLGELTGNTGLEHTPTLAPHACAAKPVTTPVYCRVRDDLRVSLQESAGKAFYLVEDLYHGRFYRVGVAEWQIASALDGRTSLPIVLERLYDQGRALQWTPERASSLCTWLVQSNLATVCDAQGNSDVERTRQLQHRKRSAVGWNPFYIKLPLLRPDRLLSRILPYARPLLSRPAVVVWFSLCFAGLYVIIADWQRFAQSATIYFAPETWLWLALVWIGLKVIHELFHGLVCKKYDGFVREAGLVLILFSPVAFVDVTSSWRFRDKWARIFTSTAGMYAEFAIAAAAAMVWSLTDSGVWNQICHSIVVTASVTTVLFNANPLMRFDGYYILSDLLEIQNLYSLGRQSNQALVHRWLFGRDAAGIAIEGWKRPLVVAYGVASAMWRVVVTASLLIAAAALFHGAGVVLALFGVITWIALPMIQFLRANMISQTSPTVPRRRLCTILVVISLGVIALLASPRPGGVTVPAIVAYADLKVVRAETRGFVESIHVTPGQWVAEGELLVALRGDDVRAELRDVELQWEQSQLRARSLNGEHDIAASQAELERLAALTERRNQLRKQVDELLVRAPVAGHVVDLHLDRLLGTFIDVGQPILRVAAESKKEIHVSIPERSYDAFVNQLGTKPTVAVRGFPRSIRSGRLSKVEPKANTTLRHPAWAAPHGGPLPVRANDAAHHNQDGEVFRLVEPRFHGVVELPPDLAKSLRDGQVGEVRLAHARESVGRWAWRVITDWARGKWRRKSS